MQLKGYSLVKFSNCLYFVKFSFFLSFLHNFFHFTNSLAIFFNLSNFPFLFGQIFHFIKLFPLLHFFKFLLHWKFLNYSNFCKFLYFGKFSFFSILLPIFHFVIFLGVYKKNIATWRISSLVLKNQSIRTETRLSLIIVAVNCSNLA